MDTSNPVLSGLIRKRQEVTGELETMYGRISTLTAALRSLDGAIRLFAPETELNEIAPRVPRYTAQPGEISRPIQDALREANEPLTVHELALSVLAARNMDSQDRDLVRAMQKRVTASLRNLQIGGVVQSSKEPGRNLKWGLVG